MRSMLGFVRGMGLSFGIRKSKSVCRGYMECICMDDGTPLRKGIRERPRVEPSNLRSRSIL